MDILKFIAHIGMKKFKMYNKSDQKSTTAIHITKGEGVAPTGGTFGSLDFLLWTCLETSDARQSGWFLPCTS